MFIKFKLVVKCKIYNYIYTYSIFYCSYINTGIINSSGTNNPIITQYVMSTVHSREKYSRCYYSIVLNSNNNNTPAHQHNIITYHRTTVLHLIIIFDHPKKHRILFIYNFIILIIVAIMCVLYDIER